MEQAKTIKLEYAFVDGMHFFVSGDVMSKGVCVGHPDLKTAYDEVSLQLSYVLHNNQNIIGECEPAVTYEQFAAWLEKAQSTSDDDKIITIPSAVIDWAQCKAA